MDRWSVMRWNEMVMFSWTNNSTTEELLEEYERDIKRFYSINDNTY